MQKKKSERISFVVVANVPGDTTDINHVPKEDVIRVLADNLSEMTLKEDDPFGLQLPEKIPEGYHLTHKWFPNQKYTSQYQVSAYFYRGNGAILRPIEDPANRY